MIDQKTSGKTKGQEETPKTISKAQARRQLSGNLESRKFPVRMSQNKHIDFVILESEVNAYQAGNIKLIVTKLGQKIPQIIIFLQ